MQSQPKKSFKHGLTQRGQMQQQNETKTPLWKTRMCTFAQMGKCAKADKCPYAHNESELNAMPDFSMSSMCPNIEVPGVACNNPKCRYAHKFDELRKVNDLLKTKTCKFFESSKGCSRGELCRFAHVTQTKANAPPSKSDSPKSVQLHSAWSEGIGSPRLIAPTGPWFQNVQRTMPRGDLSSDRPAQMTPQTSSTRSSTPEDCADPSSNASNTATTTSPRESLHTSSEPDDEMHTDDFLPYTAKTWIAPPPGLEHLVPEVLAAAEAEAKELNAAGDTWLKL